MLWAFHENRASAFSCDTYQEFFQIILSKENAKLFEGHPEFGQSAWSFIYYTHRRVAMVYRHISLQQQSSVLKRAFEQSLGFIEICRGDYNNPEEILHTQDINVDALKKQWCMDYCKAHGYTVTEVILPDQQACTAYANHNPLNISLSLH